MEKIGVLNGIAGSFLVSSGFLLHGFILFFMSSLLLLIMAHKQGNKNLMLLQGVFLLSNINGLFNYAN